MRLYLGPLSVDITDRTFSSHYWADISGTRHGHTDNLFVTLGNASACQSSWNAAGKGNIDLRGTPFKAPSSSNVFTVHGWNPSGGATFSENDQVIAITGGGHCGHTQLSAENNNRLMLEFLSPEVAALDFSESVGSIINTNGSDATGLGSVEDNLVLWLDAKNINGQNNDGISNADVSTWVDLSGGGNDVTGYSSYDVPVYQASGFNGLPSVYFDANDILHAADTGLDDPFRMDRMTIFIVGN